MSIAQSLRQKLLASGHSATDRAPVMPRDITGQLLDSAAQREGQHPHQAQQLRAAALAYLRVVR